MEHQLYFCCNCGTNRLQLHYISTVIIHSSFMHMAPGTLRGSDHWPVGNAAAHQLLIGSSWIKSINTRMHACMHVYPLRACTWSNACIDRRRHTCGCREGIYAGAQRAPPVGGCPEAGGHRARARPHSRRPGPRTHVQPDYSCMHMVPASLGALGMSCLTAQPACNRSAAPPIGPTGAGCMP